jgi:hypothetical protein
MNIKFKILSFAFFFFFIKLTLGQGPSFEIKDLKNKSGGFVYMSADSLTDIIAFILKKNNLPVCCDNSNLVYFEAMDATGIKKIEVNQFNQNKANCTGTYLFELGKTKDDFGNELREFLNANKLYAVVFETKSNSITRLYVDSKNAIAIKHEFNKLFKK